MQSELPTYQHNITKNENQLQEPPLGGIVRNACSEAFWKFSSKTSVEETYLLLVKLWASLKNSTANVLLKFSIVFGIAFL